MSHNMVEADIKTDQKNIKDSVSEKTATIAKKIKKNDLHNL